MWLWCLPGLGCFSRFVTIYRGPSHTYKVQRLIESSSYNFRIQAISEAGEGPFSDTYTFCTTKSVPPALKGKMTQRKCLKVSHGSKNICISVGCWRWCGWMCNLCHKLTTNVSLLSIEALKCANQCRHVHKQPRQSKIASQQCFNASDHKCAPFKRTSLNLHVVGVGRVEKWSFISVVIAGSNSNAWCFLARQLMSSEWAVTL